MITRRVLFAAACLTLSTCGPPGAVVRVGAPAPAPLASVPRVTRVTDLGLDAAAVQPSPDGKRLAFHAGAPGEREIWVAAADGSGATRLTRDTADDRDPAWTRDGRGLVFSSDRGGATDLWVMQADGSGARKAFALPGDETGPRVSSLAYRFFAVTPDSCTREGASGELLDTYDKVAFTRTYDGKQEVWFASLDGRHQGRLSAEGQRCHSPAWSGDGLSLTWTCGDAGAPVVVDTHAAWEQSFASALQAVGFDDSAEELGGCDEVPEGDWGANVCFKKLPRRYARHAGVAASVAAARLTEPAYSANQTVVVARDADGVLHTRTRVAEAAWAPLRYGAMQAARPVWAPDGRSVYFESAHEGHRAIYRAATAFYLQEVRDLVDYPELWGRGESRRLQEHRFVARPGTEKELYTHYEKVRYARRGPFVTADSALQLFHDEFTGLLKGAERRAQAQLLLISERLLALYAGKRGKAEAYLAVQFAVPAVLLQAAATMRAAESEEPEMEDPDTPPRRVDPIAIIKEEVGEGIAALPKALRAPVRRHVDAILAHQGMVDHAVPGMATKIKLDYSQFQVRGHYAASSLAGYFLAMTWYGLAPLPMDKATFELVAAMEATPVGKGTLYGEWAETSGMVGAFMGRPVDATVAHVAALAKAKPALARTFDAAAVARELAALRGPVAVRGADAASTGGNTYGLRISLFPKRVGLDVEVFKALTHPDVQRRGWPSSLDVMAALGVPAARKHAVAAASAEDLYDAYVAALGKLTATSGPRLAALASTDLYHSWLAMLATLATSAPTDAPDAARRMPFLRGDAWLDRLLHSSLAGFAQLKHAAVLYAFQDYSAECDSATAYQVLVEQPILPEPRGFVDPAPEFFGAMAKLAGLVYQRMNDGEAPATESELYDAEGKDLANPGNAKGFAEMLGALAAKEVRGEALTTEDYRWINHVGAVMEALFLGQAKPSTMGYAADEGRLERGVALVTDVHTNVTSNQVLELGIGRLLDLYVVVGDAVGQRMTQGAALSFFEFRHPMADRLTDETWGAMVKEGRIPAPPAWTASFLEPAPK